MKSILLSVVLAVSATPVFAEKEVYDLVSYTAPTAWKKEVKEKHNTSYTIKNLQNGSYCQIFVLSSTNSKGSLNADFDSEWQDIIIGSYGVTQAPQLTEPTTENGWHAKAGVASFAFNNGTSMAMLTTISGYNRTVSIVVVTNSQDYMPAIQAFLGSIEMKKSVSGVSTTTKPTDTAHPNALQGYMEYNIFTKSFTWKLRYPPPKK